ncbi:MAG: hypothetical protein WBH59_04935 [Atribacterales bacterium]
MQKTTEDEENIFLSGFPIKHFGNDKKEERFIRGNSFPLILGNLFFPVVFCIVCFLSPSRFFVFSRDHRGLVPPIICRELPAPRVKKSCFLSRFLQIQKERIIADFAGAIGH